MNNTDWIMLAFGAASLAGGIITIRRPKTDSTAALGWVWLAIGVLFLVGVVFDLRFLKVAVELFFGG
jgi:hypothetical protein